MLLFERKEGEKGRTTMAIYGPSGGSGGDSPGFHLLTAPIAKIQVWSGTYVNAIAFTDTTGNTITFGNTTTASSPPVEIDLEADEHIEQITGRCGQYVDSIIIETLGTRNRAFGPYGGPGGEISYVYRCNSGQEIIALWGSFGAWIDAIGVVTS